jgi:CdiI N-terminal domain
MFAIELIEKVPPVGRGRIRIGAFEEEFEASLEFWSPDDYQRQWRQALDVLLAGGDRAALIVSMTDPATANFLFWWPAYRDGDDVVFQSGVLFLEDLEQAFEPARWAAHVPAREQRSDTGEPISEWRAPLADIQRFIAASSPP